MPKPGVVGGARRRREQRGPAELPDAVEGQIEEICRDLAVQAKRMRELQEQADALRTVIRQWAGQFEPDWGVVPIISARVSWEILGIRRSGPA